MIQSCPDCGGDGWIWKEKVQVACTYCNGGGKVMLPRNCRECVYAGEKEPSKPAEIWCALWGEDREPRNICHKIYIRGVSNT